MPTGDPKRDKNLPSMGGVFNSGNLNLFAYTHQNPIKYVDPDGKAPDKYKAKLNKIANKLDSIMNQAWSDSKHGTTSVKEYGAAIFQRTGPVTWKHKKGTYGYKHYTEGKSGGINISTAGITRRGDTLIGTFHTHPYSIAEGATSPAQMQGAAHSFGDIVALTEEDISM